MKWSKYNYIYDSPKHGTLLFNQLSGAFFDISDNDTKQDMLRLKENPDKYDFSDDADTLNMLVSSGVLCEDDRDNRNLLTFALLSGRFDPKQKSLTILPTLNCNLACNYCFEEANRCDAVMSDDVIVKLKEYIKEQYSQNDEVLQLHWFGGEPLMAFGVMEEITNYIKSLNITFGASIITNAVLLNDAKIQKLKEMNIGHIQVTLDGNKETHDTKRVFKNGQGTYDIIMRNLEKLYHYIEQGNDVIVDIRINVDKENQDQYHQLYYEFKKQFPRFQVYPGIITQYQTCSTTLPCFVNHREEAEFYIRQYEKYGIVHPEFNVSMKGMRSCMAERMHTDLIGPRGEFYLCLQDVGNKDAEIGSLFEGKNISIFTMRSKRDMQSNNLLLIIS